MPSLWWRGDQAMVEKKPATAYERIVRRYLKDGDESQLYEAAQLGQSLLAKQVPPEAIVEMHAGALEALTEGMPPTEWPEITRQSYVPLMETMMAYGLAFREQLDAQRRYITERKRGEQLLRVLNEAALAMERALTTAEIFAAVAEKVEQLGFWCAVLLMDESGRVLSPRYLSHDVAALDAVGDLVGRPLVGLPVHVEEVGAFADAVRERKTIFVKDTEELVRQLLPSSAKRFAARIVGVLEVRQAIIAPLIVDEEVIGVLSVQSDELTADDMPAATVFAHQMAAALRKAKLVQDLQRSLEELKLTQVQLLQAQKLESLGRLAGGIAHDFNNLLTTMRGFASLVQMDLADDDPRWQDMQRVITAAERAAGLTRQLTLFSRRDPSQRQPMRLNAIVEETHALLKETFPRVIETKLVLEPKMWTTEADPSQMSQVLMNLCVNARDAMPEGGVLTLETRNVTLDEEYARGHGEAEPGRYVRLSVSDTGVGMSKEVQAHLFEPFFTTKGVGEGTGLGLATVYGIVKAHEGFINVYSEPGKGSTFRVYLPATSVGEAPTEEGSVVKLARGTETLLLVDDEQAVLGLGRKVLERCGYTVLVAHNGVEALEVYEERRGEIALVLLDVVMPKLAGGECLRGLQALDPEVRVLIATGHTVGTVVQELLREGAVGVVEKPYGLQSLSVAVRKALDAPRAGKDDSD